MIRRSGNMILGSLLLWGCLSFSFETPSPKDSLAMVVAAGKKDLKTARACLQLSQIYHRTNPDSAFLLLQQSIAIGEALGTPALLGEGYYLLHLHHLKNAHPQAAYKALQQMIRHAKTAQDRELQAKALFSFGAYFQQIEPPMYDSAIYFLQQAERLQEQINIPAGKWSIFIEYGHLYHRLGEHELAKKYYLNAYELAQQEPGIATRKGIALYHLVHFFRSTEDWASYSLYLENYLENYESAQGSIWLDDHHTKGILLSGGWPESKIRAIITQHQIQHHPRALALNLVQVGHWQQAQEQWTAAGQTWEQVVETSQTLKDTVLLIKTTEFAIAHAIASEQLPEALTLQEYHTALEDALYQRATNERLQELEKQYETEKKEQELRIQGLELTQKTFQRNALFGSSLLFALIAVGIFLGFRYRLKASQKLAEQEEAMRLQQIQSLEQEQQILGVEAMVEGQEKERIRIAKDLHDSLGGLLMTVKAHFNAFAGTQATDQRTLEANQLIDAACVEVRRISHRMMPRTLALSGLKEAIEDLADHVTQEGLECTLEIIGLEEEPDPHRSVMIYRILQELVENTQQHAEASQLFIQVFRHGAKLLILVEDDGKGFDYLKEKEHGQGLESIQARVDFLKGTIDFDSVQGEGTTVNIQLPFRV